MEFVSYIEKAVSSGTSFKFNGSFPSNCLQEYSHSSLKFHISLIVNGTYLKTKGDVKLRHV